MRTFSAVRSARGPAKGAAMTGVRSRLLIIIAVVAASVWAIYPPRDNLNWGSTSAVACNWSCG